MQPSSHSSPIDMRDPDCGRGKMWDVRDDWFNRGFRLSIDLWVACMMLPSGRMNGGPLLIVCLLLHGFLNLM